MDYVLYLRASTLRQGQSGLGLEGQRLIAHRFLQPGDRILSEYIEVESGRKNNRPEMAKAIVETRQAGATLLVAEMSRLARSVYFTSKLMEERVRFKACDIPNADEFTINILAAVAQKGAKDISDSTKRGLLAKKARGFTLGNPSNFTADSRALGRATVQRNAQEAIPNKQARRLASLLRRDGLTLLAIADELNAHGYCTRRGKSFHKTTVLRLLKPDLSSASLPEPDAIA
ncbi:MULTISPECIES: recombinase family protein [Hymenobacter]|uniref:Resolvase n=2 Tax=Hymenobacter TaxID=89966 RepID=A0A418QNP3_9BACT|nr:MULTISPECIES: recombinase family protein [Hymenobacter]RIY06897.1 resolvase [Hymenobacter rubripertinctus]SDY83030.1 Resolvase, N terminal domain [Hymenobacter psychrophilus]